MRLLSPRCVHPVTGACFYSTGAARARRGRGAPAESAAERCSLGLALHGRGQWGQALQVFAAAVGDEMAAGLTGMVRLRVVSTSLVCKFVGPISFPYC